MLINDGQWRAIDGSPVGAEIQERLFSIEKALAEQKRFESVLRRSAGVKESILDALPDPITYSDLSLRVVWANKAASAFLGIDRNKLIGMHCYKAWKRRSIPCENCLMEFGEHCPGEDYLSGKDLGRWKRVGYVVRNHEGDCIGVVEVATEVTELEKTKEALQREREITGSLMEHSPVFIVRIDGEGRIIAMNRAMLVSLGYNSEEVCGSEFLATIVPESHYESWSAMLEEIVSRNRPAQCESKVISRDNRDFMVRWQGFPVHNEDGTLDSCLIEGIDITDTRRLEEQLLRAQKLEAVGTLAGGIAHDFNNLLQAIGGYADLLLLRTGEEEPAYKELLSIRRAAGSASDLTEQLLSFSRKVKSQSDPTFVNSSVMNVYRILERTIPKMIKLELDLEEPPDAVRVEPSQIEQLLMNLCLNSRDAMPDGGMLRIETRSIHLDQDFCDRHIGSKSGRYVRIRVSDTGHGIDSDAMKQAFEPFFTTKGEAGGTGLGLAMVYGIVKNHNGIITCESEPGRGTEFDVFFPATWGAVSRVTPPGETELPCGHEVILLVDDDSSLRRLGAEILEKFGYQVMVAASGEDALALYEKHSKSIRLVILDLIMPGMGGSKCLKSIVEIDPAAKVLIASGYRSSNDEVLLKGLSCGFIRKPYDMASMLNTIRSVLDKPAIC